MPYSWPMKTQEVALEQGDMEVANPEVTLDSTRSISYIIFVVQVWIANKAGSLPIHALLCLDKQTASSYYQGGTK